MLSKRHSIKSKKLISFLFKKGIFLKSKLFQFRYISAKDNIFKYVILIGKKNIKKAVDRNLLKRRIKALIRTEKIITSKNCLIINFRAKYLPTYKELKEDIQNSQIKDK